MDKLDYGKELDGFVSYLNLSDYQTRAYKALFNLKEGTITAISKSAGIPMSKSYEVLKFLEDKGLVINNVGRPIKYKLIDPKMSFDNLILQKEMQMNSIKQSIELLSKGFNEKAPSSTETIQLMRSKEFVLNFLAHHVREKVTKSYSACVAFTTPNSPVMDILKTKVSQGVKVRIVGCITDKIKFKGKVAQKYKKLGAEVRILDRAVAPIRFSVFDSKYASFTLTDSKKEYITIWTDSDPIVKTINDLFSHYWKEGEEI